MNALKSAFTAVLALSSVAAIAHPIDVATSDCLNGAMATNDMIQCFATAESQWDGELNTSFRNLAADLNAGQRASLKSAEMAWLVFRDTDFAFSADFYYGLGGTMWRPVAQEYRADAVRNRVVDLSIYLNAPLARTVDTAHTDSIQQQLDSCLENNSSTNAMLQCYVQGIARYDAALNRSYGELRSLLPADQFSKLQAAEFAWVRYKDLETSFANNFFGSQQGTIWKLVSASRLLELTRGRVTQLTGFINAMNGN